MKIFIEIRQLKEYYPDILSHTRQENYNMDTKLIVKTEKLNSS